jgi:hypothetical protein
MDVPPALLFGILFLLMTDSVIEISFVGSTVAYLHHAHNDVPFQISATGSTPQFGLYPKPAHLLVNQGHTSNGAAGTALVLVCFPGFFFLWLEKRARDRSHSALDHFQDANDLSRKTRTLGLRNLLKNWKFWRWIWVGFTVLSFGLTLAAFIFTFRVTQQTATPHSQINLRTAAALDMRGIPEPYPDDRWTPENWYKAIIALRFVDDRQKADIMSHVRVMAGWRWNLIPLLLLGFVTAVLAVMSIMDIIMDYIKKKKAGARGCTGGLDGGEGVTNDGKRDTDGGHHNPEKQLTQFTPKQIK